MAAQRPGLTQALGASKQVESQDDFAEVFELEREIEQAMSERFPELQRFLVRPYQVVASESDTWLIARSGDTALCISLETERFGVGLLSGDIELTNSEFYATGELASHAFYCESADRA